MLTLSQKNTHNRVKRCNETANLGKGNKLDLAFSRQQNHWFPSRFWGRRIVSRAGAADLTVPINKGHQRGWSSSQAPLPTPSGRGLDLATAVVTDGSRRGPGCQLELTLRASMTRSRASSSPSMILSRVSSSGLLRLSMLNSYFCKRKSQKRLVRNRFPSLLTWRKQS